MIGRPDSETLQKLKAGGFDGIEANTWNITPEQAGFDAHCLWNIPGGGRNRYWDPSLVQDGKLLDLPEESYGPDITTGDDDSLKTTSRSIFT